MNRLDITCPALHSLHALYRNLNCLNLTSLINEKVCYSYPVIKTESLVIYYTVLNNKRFLELKKDYLELYKFKIPLGSDSNLINKRVKNEILVRLHKVLNKSGKENIIDYIHFIFKKRIKSIFSDVLFKMNSGIYNKVIVNKKQFKLSDYFLSFSNQFNLDCTINITRSLTGIYKVKLVASFNPFYGFIKTFKMFVTGTYKNVINQFNRILDKKIFRY